MSSSPKLTEPEKSVDSNSKGTNIDQMKSPLSINSEFKVELKPESRKEKKKPVVIEHTQEDKSFTGLPQDDDDTPEKSEK
jgi:hypothetical protein